MSSSQVLIQQYFSLRNLGGEQEDLQLTLRCLSADAVELELENLRYPEQKRNQTKKLLGVLCFYGVYCALTIPIFYNSATTQLLTHNYFVDLAFLLWTLYILQSTFALIRKERLLLCLDFGLQLQTFRFWSGCSTFIPAAHIHDIVINEVIEDLDVHYILIIRTQGSLFKRKPIIPIFNSLRPTINCLEIMYKHLNKVLNKNINT